MQSRDRGRCNGDRYAAASFVQLSGNTSSTAGPCDQHTIEADRRHRIIFGVPGDGTGDHSSPLVSRGGLQSNLIAHADRALDRLDQDGVGPGRSHGDPKSPLVAVAYGFD
jgi:hypothetical protein